eukprot:s510_g25.t1
MKPQTSAIDVFDRRFARSAAWPGAARGVFATSLSPRPDADGTTRLSFLEEAANGEETMLLEGPRPKPGIVNREPWLGQLYKPGVIEFAVPRGGLVANPYLGAITESCDITLQSPRTTTDAMVCSFYRPLYITLLGCFAVAVLVTSPFSLKQANPWGLLALFLPKLDQVPPKDEWIADTWDHFKMPQCDSGPMDGAVQKVEYWINESVWVKPRPAKHMPGKWWLFPNESGGGHWVPGHTEPAVPGHYEYKMALHHKSVPLYRTPQQEACVASRRTLFSSSVWKGHEVDSSDCPQCMSRFVPAAMIARTYLITGIAGPPAEDVSTPLLPFLFSPSISVLLIAVG